MEKQKKKPERKEGEPRISVRPGNFIIPGKPTGQPRQEGAEARAPEKAAAREGSNEQGRNAGNAKRRNRHRGNRHGRGHSAANEPSAEQQSAAKNRPAAPQKQASEEKINKTRGDRRDRRHQNDKQSRHGEVRPQQAPASKAKPAPEISESLQKELDAQFSCAPTLSFLSPVAMAEKKLAENEAVSTKEFEVDIATAAYLVEDVPCGFPVPDGKAVEVIGVRFRGAGKVYFFAPGNERFRIGEAAIVDTARGAEYGEVVMLNRRMAEKDIVQPLRSVLRRATEEDTAHNAQNRAKEAQALKICAEKIAAHKLDMNLVDAQYTFDNSKLLFYFTAEGRVDFRDLVRDLAGMFRTRIELRQIGIRDESRLIGGLGMCGRPFCCTTFLSDFGQVSVKMAKEQGLSINTSKISGCCGRLMCCLRYEQESYAAELALTPKKDTRVTTPEGPGTVVEAAPLSGMVKVRLDSAPDVAPTAYHRDTLTVQAPPKASVNESEKG